MSNQPPVRIFACSSIAISLLVATAIATPKKPTPQLSEKDEMLCEAVRRGDLESTKILVATGSNVNAKCPRGTPLHQAAGLGHVALVQFLIQSGANVRATDWLGYTPMAHAIKGGHAAVVQILIAAGVGVNDVYTWEDMSTSYLSMAAGTENAETVKLLLNAGADVNWVGTNGFTALHEAAYGCSTAIVDMLLKAGAKASGRAKCSVNDVLRNRTPYEIAKDKGNDDCAEILFQAMVKEMTGSQPQN